MRALIQRVRSAKVTVNGAVTGKIDLGIVVLLGVAQTDTESEAEHLARKVTHLRIFPDAESKMNLSLIDVGGELLAVSQFTLYGDTHKGNRPSYSEAASAEIAEPLYEYFLDSCRRNGIRVQSGVFQAHMMVELLNDGPVTLLCEAKSK
ncbi:MAG TPA: D-aminoacyl-tRNA deacylase [Bryobacteraceae bacterium]|nr:D-aminoacyl-tRNA deacylase [Bryobacteraceae bacterium]